MGGAADLHHGGSDAVGHIGHGGGQYVFATQGLHDIQARLWLELSAQQVVLARKVGLHGGVGLEHLLLPFQQQQARVGGSKVAGDTDKLVLLGAAARNQARRLALTQGRDGNHQVLAGGGDVQAYNIHMRGLAAGPHAIQQLLHRLQVKAIGDADVDRQLRGHGIHAQQVGNGHRDHLVAEMAQGHVCEVEMDVFQENARGGDDILLHGVNDCGIVTDADHRRSVFHRKKFGELCNQVVLAQLRR